MDYCSGISKEFLSIAYWFYLYKKTCFKHFNRKKNVKLNKRKCYLCIDEINFLFFSLKNSQMFSFSRLHRIHRYFSGFLWPFRLMYRLISANLFEIGKKCHKTERKIRKSIQLTATFSLVRVLSIYSDVSLVNLLKLAFHPSRILSVLVSVSTGDAKASCK